MLAKVLFHSSCMDGKMAAYVMSLHLKDKHTAVEYIPVNYNEAPPVVEGHHVYIVDFSYPREVLVEMSKVAKSIVMLDHHLTAAQQWGGYFWCVNHPDLACPNELRIAKNYSGAGLAFIHILRIDESYHTPRLQAVVEAVQDRDLWLFELKDTKIIFEMLNGLDGDFFEAMDKLIYEYSEEAYNTRISHAQCSLDLREKLAVEYSAMVSMVQFQGHTIPVTNIPVNFASRVGELLCADHPFSITYQIRDDKALCSLRSHVEHGMDVSEIAKRFNGGGHLHAAGMRLTVTQLVDLLNSKL